MNNTGPVLDQPKGYHFGWMTQILPYCEQKNVYNHLNFKLGLYEAQNLTSRDLLVDVFLCPSDVANLRRGPTGLAMSSYAGCHNDVEAPIDVNNTGVLFLNSSVRYEDITDGMSLTIFVSEKMNDGLDQGWASGTRATLRNTGSRVAHVGGRGAGGRLVFSVVEDDEIGNTKPMPGAAKAVVPVAEQDSPAFVGSFGSRHPGRPERFDGRRLGSAPQDLDSRRDRPKAGQSRRRRADQLGSILSFVEHSHETPAWLHSDRADDGGFDHPHLGVIDLAGSAIGAGNTHVRCIAPIT